MIGIILLNGAFLAVGAVLLWGLGAFDSFHTGWRLLGLAHVVGLAAVVLLCIALLVLGASLGLALGLSFAAVVAASVVLGVRRRKSFRLGKPGWSRATLLGLVLAGPTLIFLGSMARLSPTLGVWEPDAVSTWTFRAKALYYADGLNVPALRSSGAFAYPIFESTVQALSFLAAGTADDLVIHVQFAILLTSFLLGVAGIASLAGAPAYAIWPLLGLFAITPEVRLRALSPLADLPLDYFFALASLLLVVWLERRQRWLLVSAALLLGAAVSTKREGLPLAAVALAATALASYPATRRVSVGLVGAAGAILVLFAPWRVWVAVHGSAGDVGNLSVASLHPSLHQVPPALRLLLERTFAYGSWRLVVPFAIILAVLAASRSSIAARRDAAFYGIAAILSFIVFAAIWLLVPDLQTAANQEQPAVRLVGAFVALSAAMSPLLAARALRGDPIT